VRISRRFDLLRRFRICGGSRMCLVTPLKAPEAGGGDGEALQPTEDSAWEGSR